MVVDPVATAVARPEPLTVATVEADEVQIAVAVKSWLLPSLLMPIAVN
jgi:hypothetical protein